MNSRVDKGMRWAKYTLLLASIYCGCKALFGFGRPWQRVRACFGFVYFVPSVLAAPVAFLLGWLTGGSQNGSGANPASPPIPPVSPQTTESRLQELATLKSKGLITDSEYEQQRAAILRAI